jgi:hypothetical protein
MDKARRHGWFGTVNTLDSMRRVFETFEKRKMIPPIASV